MKNVIESDIIRAKELQELGWKIILIDNKNFKDLRTIIKNIAENADVY